MLIIPQSMQDALDAGVTTHCWCWRVIRKDGAVYGFSDHDRELTIDGVKYSPRSGFGAGAVEAERGLAASRADLAGAIDHQDLTTDDLAAGVWDGARVEIWRVDWSRPDLRVMTAQGDIGETREQGGQFEAELLGLSHKLENGIGRVFARRCDAELGDARCGVAPDHPGFSLGCDKSYATCRERFANTVSFRGFPFLVGNDVLQTSPASSARRDGSSRGIRH